MKRKLRSATGRTDSNQITAKAQADADESSSTILVKYNVYKRYFVENFWIFIYIIIGMLYIYDEIIILAALMIIYIDAKLIIGGRMYE